LLSAPPPSQVRVAASTLGAVTNVTASTATRMPKETVPRGNRGGPVRKGILALRRPDTLSIVGQLRAVEAPIPLAPRASAERAAETFAGR
jgi:hypothetical protein